MSSYQEELFFVGQNKKALHPFRRGQGFGLIY
jgi:hypothetical protein